MRARFDFSDYIAERTRDFVGREWIFEWMKGERDRS